MKIKKLLSLLLSAALLMAPLAACGSGAPSASGSGSGSNVESSAAPDLSQDTEEVDTGDASLDDPLNQDQIGEKELLVVSFGTSYNDNRRLTIGAIETALAEAFPDWSVRRAFTSQIIIDRVKERDGVEIDNGGSGPGGGKRRQNAGGPAHPPDGRPGVCRPGGRAGPVCRRL